MPASPEPRKPETDPTVKRQWTTPVLTELPISRTLDNPGSGGDLNGRS